MTSPSTAGPLAVSLNSPSTLLHWSIFQVTVANLVLIAVMFLIFGAALLLPFPGGRGGDLPADPDEDKDAARAEPPVDQETARMWTYRLRRGWLRVLPPAKLLPDRQPAYVRSWIYVFGVGSLAALVVAVGSGFAIAIGGADWWHTNPIGHFFNSLHLWSVELFMALLVIHLWGKFWMAAWRGRRTMTWITGVVAFVASVIECFTGYLSQQNFDSQWISTSAKDAFNPSGVGAFFNVLNVGQMLLWHVVLIPVALIAIVGAHVLLVRVRGVAHPLPVRPGWRDRKAQRATAAADAAPWRGPSRRYDILKEGTVAVMIVLALTVGLAGLLSSPNDPSVTVATWSKLAPADFLGTAAAELNGTSKTAAYGPPYNNQSGSTQSLLFAPAKISGVTLPVDAASDFVIRPLTTLASTDPAIAAPLAAYKAASSAQQLKWATAYGTAEAKVKFVGGNPVVPAAVDGPVPALMAAELTLARSGALDASLINQQTFYGTNYTKPLQFIEDGQYFAGKAAALNLTGAQWGVMNETGSYPGQPWLWLYTLWYQVPGWNHSANADLIAIYMTGLATILLLAVPFIPGLRDIPRLIPLHRLIWRSWNASGGTDGSGTAGAPGAPPARLIPTGGGGSHSGGTPNGGAPNSHDPAGREPGGGNPADKVPAAQVSNAADQAAPVASTRNAEPPLR